MQALSFKYRVGSDPNRHTLSRQENSLPIKIPTPYRVRGNKSYTHLNPMSTLNIYSPTYMLSYTGAIIIQGYPINSITLLILLPYVPKF